MKKIILILTMLFSIQAFSQNETVTNHYSDEEIKMILDTTYVFFVLNDTVYSKKNSTGYKGIVTACKFLRYESKLSKQEINSAYNYFQEWWIYDVEYSNSIPNKNNLHTNIKELLFSKNEYSKIIDAIIVMRSEIYNEKYSKTEKTDLFEKNAKIVGIPENEIPVKNPFSDDYDILDGFDLYLGLAYENIIIDIELAEANAELQKSLTQGREKILKSARALVAAGGNPADIEGWKEISKELNITLEDLK